MSAPAKQFISSIYQLFILNKMSPLDMPPLISRCLCLNLESEIIPSSDRFQDQSQHRYLSDMGMLTGLTLSSVNIWVLAIEITSEKNVSQCLNGYV